MTKDDVIVAQHRVLVMIALKRIWFASQLYSWAKKSNYSD